MNKRIRNIVYLVLMILTTLQLQIFAAPLKDSTLGFSGSTKPSIIGNGDPLFGDYIIYDTDDRLKNVNTSILNSSGTYSRILSAAMFDGMYIVEYQKDGEDNIKRYDLPVKKYYPDIIVKNTKDPNTKASLVKLLLSSKRLDSGQEVSPGLSEVANGYQN